MRKNRIVDITNIFNVGGIYIWKCKGKFVYIGTSKNLLQRTVMPYHIMKLVSDFPDSTIKLYIINDEIKRKKLEFKLIRRYKPILNLTGNPIPNRTRKRASKFKAIDREQGYFTRRDYNNYQQYGKVL